MSQIETNKNELRRTSLSSSDHSVANEMGEKEEQKPEAESAEPTVADAVNEPEDLDLEKAPTQASKSSRKLRKVTTAQDWEGPDDPENPINWSTWKKMYHFWPVAFLCFAVTVGSSLVSPANQDFQEYFHVSRTAAILPLTLFVVGLGCGPLIAAPLSEQFGRSLVYKITAPCYILFSIGAALSNSFGSLLVCRLLAGLAGAPVLAVGAGTNADLFAVKDRAMASAAYISSPFLGPAFGPIVGGFAAQFKGWRWTIWCNVFIASLAFLLVLPMHETYKKVILQRRAKRNNLPAPQVATPKGLAYVKFILTITLFRPVQMLLQEPTVLLFAAYNTFTFSVLFSFFAAYPYTYGRVYGFNTWQTGLTFSAIGVGVLLAAFTAIMVDKLVYQKKRKQALSRGETSVAPEERLYAAMMGAIGLPIGLFWFGWTARDGVHWIWPTLAGIPFAWGNLCLFLSAVLYQIDVYGPLNGASAMAANGLARYVLGGCFPLWTVQMYQALGIGWATSLLGFVCVVMLPIPFVFYKFGPAIRKRSRYPTSGN